jgi:hypothetical protein
MFINSMSKIEYSYILINKKSIPNICSSNFFGENLKFKQIIIINVKATKVHLQ